MEPFEKAVLSIAGIFVAGCMLFGILGLLMDAGVIGTGC